MSSSLVRATKTAALLTPFLFFSVATLDSNVEGDGCQNTCEYARDGACDDGGEGSEYSLCELGTDCDDCGERGAAVGPGGSSNTFTCFSGDLCVEYSITDSARASDLRSQCADSVDGHDCARDGRASCRHQNTSGDVTCTVTTNPPSDHDSICANTDGTPGC